MLYITVLLVLEGTNISTHRNGSLTSAVSFHHADVPAAVCMFGNQRLTESCWTLNQVYDQKAPVHIKVVSFCVKLHDAH